MSDEELFVPFVGNETLFDLRPAQIGHFALKGRSAIPVGRPNLNGWVQAMQFAVASHESSPYWVADLMAYADSREDWRAKLDQAITLTGYKEHTLHNLGYIGRRVEEQERQIAPSIGHAAAVAPLDRELQTEVLTKARDNHWTVSETRKEAQATKRRKVIEGQAVLEGQFRVWLADCPWICGTKPPSGSGAQSHYDGMTVNQLSALAVAANCAKDAVLFMWVTAPMLYYASEPEKGPDPYRIIRAWGFTAKTGGVWDKVNHNFGNYLSIRHEHLIIATRGSCLPDRPTPMFDSVFTERQDGIHSSKPASVRTMIERLYDGPRIEMFAREQSDNWATFGNDSALTRTA